MSIRRPKNNTKHIQHFSVRRSRTLDFKNSNGNNAPVRSHSTIAVTSKIEETSFDSQFEDSIHNSGSENISKQKDIAVKSLLSSTTKHDTATQIQLKCQNRPASNSPPFPFNITQPDLANLVSPRESPCSTGHWTRSELGLEEEDASSDESWGMLLLP